ncbi:MAG TPA: SIMPL domain-containing protein [Vicinamibacterales bacterium]|nr:SIMPL domain-containing protein [Vicinamibacterales bacterium]
MLRTIAVLVCVAVPASTASAQNPSGPPVIVTTGQASIDMAPDVAWVSIASEARASTPSAAQQQSAEAMTAVQAALTRAGIGRTDIRTTGYSVQADIERSGGRTRVIGYIARNQIEVRVRDLTRLGSVIDAAGVSGATSMSGLRFDLADRATAERDALRQAVEDAMGRARAIADGARVTLGPIVRIDEQSQFRPVYAREMLAAAAPVETPISPGQVQISAQVTVTVQIR